LITTIKPIGTTSKAVSPRPEPFSPRPDPISPQPKAVGPKSKPVEPESQPSVFDTLGFITRHIESKTRDIFNNITNAALPHYSPDCSSSKSAESFCGTNLLNEHDFLNNIPTASASVRPMSPLNLFAGIKFESSETVLPSPEQIKAQVKSVVKQKEKCQNQQEKHKNQNINGNSHKNFLSF